MLKRDMIVRLNAFFINAFKIVLIVCAMLFLSSHTVHAADMCYPSRVIEQWGCVPSGCVMDLNASNTCCDQIKYKCTSDPSVGCSAGGTECDAVGGLYPHADIGPCARFCDRWLSGDTCARIPDTLCSCSSYANGCTCSNTVVKTCSQQSQYGSCSEDTSYKTYGCMGPGPGTPMPTANPASCGDGICQANEDCHCSDCAPCPTSYVTATPTPIATPTPPPCTIVSTPVCNAAGNQITQTWTVTSKNFTINQIEGRFNETPMGDWPSGPGDQSLNWGTGTSGVNSAAVVVNTDYSTSVAVYKDPPNAARDNYVCKSTSVVLNCHPGAVTPPSCAFTQGPITVVMGEAPPTYAMNVSGGSSNVIQSQIWWSPTGNKSWT